LQVLITGAGGFVGAHLLNFLRSNTTDQLHGTIFTEKEWTPALAEACTVHLVDLREPEAVQKLVGTIRPDRVFHLAGQAYVPRSFEAPWETIEGNTRPLVNLLESIRLEKLNTRILVIGSAEMYGPVRPDQIPITEETPLFPASPYSVSKIAQDMLAQQYFYTYQLHTVRVRPFNHIGPGQRGRFAVASFASQIVQIERGELPPIVYVGDLSAERDFTDVRDVVRAYHLTLEKGAAGAVYNVCQGRSQPMQLVLDTLLRMSKRPVEVRVAADRLRPSDIPKLTGSAEKLRAATGWQPQISLEQTLQDILEDWRGYRPAQL
jgi:GDP-4-dehydro-6-deoxy-D-mannose reductase